MTLRPCSCPIRAPGAAFVHRPWPPGGLRPARRGGNARRLTGLHQRGTIGAFRPHVASQAAGGSRKLHGRGQGKALASSEGTQLAGQTQKQAVLVKICGLTRPEDAAAAADAGARFAGMILWPKAKRYVAPPTAKLIADAARAGGACPVGVFVDESAEDIVRTCQDLGLTVAQLHGDAAREALPLLPEWLTTIYVAHVDPSGTIVTPLPAGPRAGETGAERLPAWLLLDGLQGGSGVTIDWAKLQVPQGCFREGWILAGGLTPGNVGAAVAALSPSMVDVSSGVCSPDKLAKDHGKIKGFVQGAQDMSDVVQTSS